MSPDDWALYLEVCRRHRVQIDVKDIEEMLDEYRREIASDINSLFRVDIKGFRIVDSLLRLSIALAKLTLCDIVTAEHVECAAKLIEAMLTRIRTLRQTQLRPITPSQLARLLFVDRLIEHVLRPGETVTIDELYERLKRELMDRGYMVSKDILDRALETPLALQHVFFPEQGKVKLAKAP